MRTPDPPSEEGFSVVEAMVALAIIAALTASFFSMVAIDASATRKVSEKRLAGALAESLLAQASAGDAAAALARSGEADGLTWRIDISGHGSNARAGGPPLEAVTVIVWGRSSAKPLMRVQTLRLTR